MPIALAFNSVVSFLLGAKYLWKVVRNWRTLRSTIEDAGGVFKGIHDRGATMPNCAEAKVLIACAEKILKTDLIDVPGVDESNIVRLLQEMQHNMVCTLEEKEKKNGLRS